MVFKDYPQEAFAETDLAYAAGFFEGEGSISFYLTRPHKNKAGNMIPSFLGNVVIGNTDKFVLDWFHAMFGGNVNKRDPKFQKLGTKDIWTWQLFGHKAKAWLKLVLPYFKLELKIEKAEDFIAFFSTTEHEPRLELIEKWKQRRAPAQTERSGTSNGDATVGPSEMINQRGKPKEEIIWD